MRCDVDFSGVNIAAAKDLGLSSHMLNAVGPWASPVGARSLSSHDSWALECRLSVVIHRLSCSKVCGIVPDQQ